MTQPLEAIIFCRVSVTLRNNGMMDGGGEERKGEGMQQG